MKHFNLPDLGEGLTDGIIREWYIKAGDTVETDQPIVAIETAKALVDVPSPRDGVIEKLFGKVGDTINVDEPIVSYTENDETESVERKDTGTVVGKIQAEERVLDEPAMGVTPQKSAGAKVKATPQVKVLAKKLNVNLSDVKGSGKDGMITAADVKLAADKGQAPVNSGEEISMPRRAMAMAMTRSHHQVAPISVVDDVDIQNWFGRDNLTIRILKAISEGLTKNPIMNAYFYPEHMQLKKMDKINIGIAVDSEEGLFVPVIHDCAHKSDDELRNIIEDYKQKAKTKTFLQTDLQDATFVMSNYGMFAGRYATPIIIPPMIAILGVGRVFDKVFIENDKPVAHKILPVSLSMDHRAVTGGEATRFLKDLMEALG